MPKVPGAPRQAQFEFGSHALYLNGIAIADVVSGCRTSRFTSGFSESGGFIVVEVRCVWGTFGTAPGQGFNLL